tara:strand:- start:8447 stop:8668 length:222 start_codon:yes stop_codon:yes gene_type:complete
MQKTARNPITGDKIKTKVTDDTKFSKGYDDIDWSNKVTPNKLAEPVQLDLFDEERINIIGKNGNDGLHYQGGK